MNARYDTSAVLPVCSPLEQQHHLVAGPNTAGPGSTKERDGQGRAPGLKLAPVCVSLSFACPPLSPSFVPLSCPHILLDLDLITRGVRISTLGSSEIRRALPAEVHRALRRQLSPSLHPSLHEQPYAASPPCRIILPRLIASPILSSPRPRWQAQIVS